MKPFNRILIKNSIRNILILYQYLEYLEFNNNHFKKRKAKMARKAKFIGLESNDLQEEIIELQEKYKSFLQANSEKVITPDNLNKSYPHIIIYGQCSYNTMGMGVLVAPNLILTAAHNLLEVDDKNNKKILKSNGYVVIGRNLQFIGKVVESVIENPKHYKRYGIRVANIKRIFYLKTYKNKLSSYTDESNKNDLCLVEIDKPLGNLYGFFPLNMNSEVDFEKTNDVFIPNFNTHASKLRLNNVSLNNASPAQDDNYLKLKIITQRGQSGSPIISIQDSNIQVIGIHTKREVDLSFFVKIKLLFIKLILSENLHEMDHLADDNNDDNLSEAEKSTAEEGNDEKKKVDESDNSDEIDLDYKEDRNTETIDNTIDLTLAFEEKEKLMNDFMTFINTNQTLESNDGRADISSSEHNGSLANNAISNYHDKIEHEVNFNNLEKIKDHIATIEKSKSKTIEKTREKTRERTIEINYRGYYEEEVIIEGITIISNN